MSSRRKRSRRNDADSLAFGFLNISSLIDTNLDSEEPPATRQKVINVGEHSIEANRVSTSNAFTTINALIPSDEAIHTPSMISVDNGVDNANFPLPPAPTDLSDIEINMLDIDLPDFSSFGPSFEPELLESTSKVLKQTQAVLFSILLYFKYCFLTFLQASSDDVLEKGS